MNEELKKELTGLAEPEYKQFNSKLIPNINPDTILGVRLPVLRKIAARLAKGEWREYLEEAADDSFEEIMLQGMVIGRAKMDFPELLARVERFLPKIDNWAVCDSFCGGLKQVEKHREEMWPFLVQCLADDRAYVIRFGAVMLMDYDMEEDRVEEALRLLDAVCHEDYYVKMAVAWVLSIYYVHFPEHVMPYLQKNHLDDFTYNKALQKITESRRISPEEKERIRGMKRKKH